MNHVVDVSNTFIKRVNIVRHHGVYTPLDVDIHPQIVDIDVHIYPYFTDIYLHFRHL